MHPPLTLKHNDFGPGNILFDRGPPAVIDWASMGLGRGTRDIGWFPERVPPAGGSPRHRYGAAAGVSRDPVEEGVRDYAFSDCYDDFRFAILQRFRSIVSTIAVMPFTAAQKQQVIDYSLPRNCAAILDHDAGSLLR